MFFCHSRNDDDGDNKSKDKHKSKNNDNDKDSDKSKGNSLPFEQKIHITTFRSENLNGVDRKN